MKALDIHAFASDTRRRRLHLFLDFDGTLSPHRPDGELSVILPEAKTALQTLARAPGVKVSIVSGRPISDLKPRVGVPRASYAGNHGLVIVDPDAPFEHPQAASVRKSLHAAARIIRAMARAVPRAEIRHNGLSLSLNIGRVPPAGRRAVNRMVATLRNELRGLRLRWQEGHLGWDLIADVGWNKGDALSHLMRTSPQSMPIAIGDGTADEAMFERASRTGIAIRVGEPRRSAASCFVRTPREVAALLQALV